MDGAWHAVWVTEPLPRSRATVFVQVLVAALFLAVIGGSVGLALGLRDRDRADDRGSGDRGNSATGGGQNQPGGGQDQSGGSPSQPGSGASEPGDGGSSPASCPPEAARQAGRDDLVQVLHIETVQSEVWICRDDQGGLYYQGRRFSDDGRLFLSDVQQEGDEYVATNVSDQGKTIYRVSREKLVIEDAGGGPPDEQQVINSDG